MAIYLLTRVDAPGYDEYEGKVIRARHESKARILANENCGDEGQIWNDPTLVECQHIQHEGVMGVILEAFNAG